MKQQGRNATTLCPREPWFLHLLLIIIIIIVIIVIIIIMIIVIISFLLRLLLLSLVQSKTFVNPGAGLVW